jgi:O-succinylbenzoate synthase
MKLEELSLYHVRMPLVAPFETSFGRIDHRECLVVRLASDGLVGWGEVAADYDPGYSYETTGTAWHILSQFAAPLFLGKDVADAGDFQRHVAKIRGHQLAKAGVEMALWDLLGKRDGRSLRQMLGGQRETVEVGVSIGLQRSPQMLVKTVENYLSKGYARVKIKIKPGRDVGDTSAVRKAFPQLRLQVDANSAYSLESAAGLRPLDDLDLLLIEQPLYEDDIW